SLAEMIREADREDQIAAARQLPRDVTLQVPDAPLVKQGGETVAQNTTPANLPPPAGTYAFAPTNPKPAPAKTTVADTSKTGTVEDLSSFVPAPKSLISDQASANVAAVNTGGAGSQNAVLTSLPKATETSLSPKPEGSHVAQLSLLPQ